MAGFRIPSGKEPDTCETACAHKDCAETRRMLLMFCDRCGEQFVGGDMIVQRSDYNDPAVLAHWTCELRAVPA